MNQDSSDLKSQKSEKGFSPRDKSLNRDSSISEPDMVIMSKSGHLCEQPVLKPVQKGELKDSSGLEISEETVGKESSAQNIKNEDEEESKQTRKKSIALVKTITTGGEIVGYDEFNMGAWNILQEI